MDPDTGDLPHADIRVRDGVIQEIGTGLQTTAGARIIDVPGKVVRSTLRARAWYVRGCA